jgi:hypothetical protein
MNFHDDYRDLDRAALRRACESEARALDGFERCVVCGGDGCARCMFTGWVPLYSQLDNRKVIAMNNKKVKIYVAGPMRGKRYYNFARFDVVKRWLLGFEVQDWFDGWLPSIPLVLRSLLDNDTQFDVVSPHDMDLLAGFDVLALPSSHDWSQYPKSGFDLDACYQRCFDAVKGCDYVYMLSGWTDSTGASAEYALAEWMGKCVIEDVFDWSRFDDRDYMWKNIDFLCAQRAATSEIKRSDGDCAAADESVCVCDENATEGEVRMVDERTGGAKGQKLARFDLLPWDALWEVAEVYGEGVKKYDLRNWERGYNWSLSYQAMQCHAVKFWQLGVRDDAELRKHHMACSIFHSLALLAFDLRGSGTDDRPCCVVRDLQVVDSNETKGE